MKHSLMLVVLTTACASVDPYVTTGELLHATGQEFVSVGTAMNQGLDAHTVSAEQYEAWAEFATHFKQAYAAAVMAFDMAVQLRDPAARADVQATLMTLAAELAKFTPMVIEVMGGAQ